MKNLRIILLAIVFVAFSISSALATYMANITYDYIDKAGELIAEIDTLHTKFKEISMWRDELERLRVQILDHGSELELIQEFLTIEEPYQELLKLSKKYNSLKSRQQQLDILNYSILERRQELNHLTDWLTVEERYVELQRLVDKYSKCKAKYIDLKNIYNSIERHKELRESAGKRLKLREKEREQLISTLDICPTCGRPWK